MYDHILFQGPWVQGKGENPTRILMHAETTEGKVVKFIIHLQYKDKGKLHYESGDYFHASWENALARAFQRFGQRCANHYHEGRKFLYLDQPGDALLDALATDPNQ